MTLKEKLDNLPAKPGCYLFKDRKGTILYVGKAGVLRNRVRSYFQKSRPFHPKLEALMRRVSDLEWIITDSEVEALILEYNLIKEHRPRYNVTYRDDKSYPYIRITNEDFPQVFITRKLVRDGSRYFGPYTNVKDVRFTLKTLQRIFTIRSCKFDLNEETIRAKKVPLCLDYYIKKCRGPCQGLQSKEDYNEMIRRVRRFLEGKTGELANELRSEMQAHADRLEYEEAALLRDRLEALENYRNSQKIVQNDFRDRDIVAVVKEENDACAVLFRIREGKVIGRLHRYISKAEWKEENELAEDFLNNYYFGSDDIPQEILVQQNLEGGAAIENWLGNRSGRRVRVIVPRIGEKKKLVEMALKNARYLMEELKLQKLKAKDYIPHAIKALQRDLRLPRPPRRMECFDISNIQGSDPVASMVCFVDGKPKKSAYRKFKIQIKDTPDDFAMMREVIKRRYSRLLREKKPLPDLIVVDGGKGQLSSALAVLAELELHDQPIIGLAKRLEEVFLPGISDAQMLPHTSSALKLLQQIRNEAHRFAVTFHRQRRRKRTLTSKLDQIEGIGPKRRARLLARFGSVKNIATASVKDLIEEGGLPTSTAEKVFAFFHQDE
ncbi:MAG TPA: excinuclease ABC subunit C [Caldithrix abyssi]|uniref:UvrABC system protein C n=1 Tax=Caldithrix abyssi TaxID=187145 RepID=A0A7V4U2U9_CALAY|nr:excinuclease ABC subunit C [Caldithrix abyssi]